MKTLCLLMIVSAGTVCAGTGVMMQERVVTVSYYEQTPRIPYEIMQGIKDLAVRRHPAHPKKQLEAVNDGVNAYLALQLVPNTNAKRVAEEYYPFDFPKQLYLAQRPLQD